MGESGKNTRRCETLLSLHVSDLDISELWRLDTIGATIEFHLKNAPDHYKEAAHTLLESFYVDNLVCSVNSKEKLDKLIVKSQEILEEGKFELRGWEHNNLDPQTENTVPTERRSVPVLGLKWDLDQDLLSVDIKVHESKNEI
ncbi:integrase catalytic domain-containing protein [Trichonephila clavipes]|nr:integrase catalytic domain-containing protein [Trichonephila clavipes]